MKYNVKSNFFLWQSNWLVHQWRWVSSEHAAYSHTFLVSTWRIYKIYGKFNWKGAAEVWPSRKGTSFKTLYSCWLNFGNFHGWSWSELTCDVVLLFIVWFTHQKKGCYIYLSYEADAVFSSGFLISCHVLHQFIVHLKATWWLSWMEQVLLSPEVKKN